MISKFSIASSREALLSSKFLFLKYIADNFRVAIVLNISPFVGFLERSRQSFIDCTCAGATDMTSLWFVGNRSIMGFPKLSDFSTIRKYFVKKFGRYPIPAIM
jgi:hypothetical protein